MTTEPLLWVLGRGDLEKIHDAGLRILQETGVAFRHSEAMDIFRRRGFEVDGETVRFSSGQVQSALDSCPSTFRFRALNPGRTVTVGKQRPLIQPAFGCVFVQEPGKPRRRGVLEDYANYQKLVQAYDSVALGGGFPIVPSELDPETRHLHVLHTALRHTDKPIIGWELNQRQTNEMLDMMEIAFGGGKVLEEDYVMASAICPSSPLAYYPDALECLLAHAGRGQPLFLTPASMGGITAPISPLGTTVLQNAESLAGLVLIQLIRPGLPVVCSTASTIAYLKSARFCTGSPEYVLINAAGNQMTRDLYGLPTRTLTGHTDAKIVDYQAGMESMQSVLMSVLAGAEILTMPLGTLDSWMTISFEKLVLDEEMFRRVLCITEGLAMSELSDSVSVIQEVGIGGEYLTHRDTLDNFRSRWVPDVSNWDSHGAWEAAGSKDAVQVAGEVLEELLARAPESVLDPAIDRELLAYKERALGDRGHGEASAVPDRRNR
jgi:trimethylamine--corrinoid protein Co-methyltransferase